MNIEELIAKLQEFPDKTLPVYTIAEFSGIWGVVRDFEVKVVHNHEESGSWYKQDDIYPRLEIE